MAKRQNAEKKYVIISYHVFLCTSEEVLGHF